MRWLLLLMFVGLPGWGCTCVGYPSPKEAWMGSPLVFSGTIDETDPKITSEDQLFGEQSAWVRVTEPFKGAKAGQVFKLHTIQSSCSGGYSEGLSMLFYLFPGTQTGSWETRACHRTQRLDGAADDLKFLRGLPGSASGNRVSGTVQLWEDSPSAGFSLNRALPSVSVHLIGTEKSYNSVTDSDGLYEFRGIRPGSYTVKVDYPEGMTLRFPIGYGDLGSRQQASRTTNASILVVTPESGNGFDFVLSADTQISGRVLDPTGQPMKDVCLEIEALQGNTANGSRVFDCTEKDGSYALTKMPPGSYRIVVNRTGRMSASSPFGRLYYPGASEVTKASVVTIAAGQHLANLDIRIPELAPRIELRGRLIFSDGTPLPNESVDFRGNDGNYTEHGRTDSNGNFAFQILAACSGQISSELLLWREQENACPQFGAKFNPNGFAAGVKSVPHSVGGDVSLSGLEIAFPFPSCDAWLSHQAELRKVTSTRTPSAQ